MKPTRNSEVTPLPTCRQPAKKWNGTSKSFLETRIASLTVNNLNRGKQQGKTKIVKKKKRKKNKNKKNKSKNKKTEQEQEQEQEEEEQQQQQK